jgi:hypothetical protein
MALEMLYGIAMTLPFAKAKKILIPDVPPPKTREGHHELVIAGIGILCATAAVAAVLFVFLGA